MIETILRRRSIREFSEKRISDEDLKTILTCAMSGPSAVNSKDWSFIVVRDKKMLEKIADTNGQAAQLLKGADVGIVVCGDLSRSFVKAPDFWIIDGSIATQNLILSAFELGIGSCWLGTWPLMDRVEKQGELLGLPENAKVHSLVALGYAKDPLEMEKGSRSTYEESQVHYEKW